MGRTEKAGDAVNLLNFAGPRSLAELRGARADGIKNIDSISSLKPESKKCLKEAELLGYDVFVSFEGPKTLSVLKRKRGAEPQNGAMLVASNNRKEENEYQVPAGKYARASRILLVLPPLHSTENTIFAFQYVVLQAKFFTVRAPAASSS
ncbi:hypothetical protein HPP92_017160 [Vanilla planifolia]|uniref:Uncharacterized protein n=1 Tax=Vanilla planifolia TaxID=51239 RepID=A0A835QH60_VANPL|nr:hypothetical protein HPP92_017160 [Vanilla planifolia]